ncbi:adenylosuccinate synthetase [Candidatus Saccharibacteria bacterium]|nr:adenylosuccinate synthetase [Candidatus Saccharibacteria bacterium]
MTDLGPGNSGKGSIVHALNHRVKPDIIMKRGGAQGSHTVYLRGGRVFNFTQWGCGTFEGTHTYLTPQMVISPVELASEAAVLKDYGVLAPYELLTCDAGCLVVTSYHRLASEIEEYLLCGRPCGVAGSGVGRAYRMQTTHPELCIYAKDLRSRDRVKQLLTAQADYYRERYRNVGAGSVLPGDIGLLRSARDFLYSDRYLDSLVEQFVNVGGKLRLCSLKSVLAKHQTAILECSYGVLTDSVTGLSPSDLAIRTLPIISVQMLEETGFTGDIAHLAVHRASELNRTRINHALSSCSDIEWHGLCLTHLDQIGSVVGAYERAKSIAERYFHMPLAVVSFGPALRDKIFTLF